MALSLLGYPKQSFSDAQRALRTARELNQAAALMNTLTNTSFSYIFCREYGTAAKQLDELVALSDEKGSWYWKAVGMMLKGCVLVTTGNADGGIKMLIDGITRYRSTGAVLFMPLYISVLANAYAQLYQFHDVWRCISDAMTAIESTKETIFEAEVQRMAGEVALASAEPEVAKAETCFQRALAIACQQKAKTWELRAAIRLARLWRDQGKRDEARDLLAPVYGWFTEGFDTPDLNEAKTLLDALAS
jgi:predicted ATPase